MKLASLKSSHRDGILCVVNTALNLAVKADPIAETLQYALDHWMQCEPPLCALSKQLHAGECPLAFPFEEHKVMAPLPRAYQWADASAYVNHVELVRKARGAEMPQDFWENPLMYQGGSDHLIGPADPIIANSEKDGIDFEAEIAVITDDVAMGVSREQAGQHIKLLLLVNDISLRNLIPGELSKGFGFFQSKPASAFSPVAVSVDELGDNWDGGKLHLPLITHLNDELFGQPNAGVDMIFDFPTLIAHAAKTRKLIAGTIIGSGTVSNTDRSVGSSCLVEKRMLEIIANGQPSTPFMKFGDRVRIEMFDQAQRSIFGAIDQEVVEYVEII